MAAFTLATYCFVVSGCETGCMGGVENNQFYLQNCGFFSHFTPLNTVFERKPMGKEPDIRFDQLPNQ